MKTVGEHIRAWLDEIGADGLMPTNPRIGERDFFDPSDINLAIDCYGASSLIPAFRHADGTYHTTRECPCGTCTLVCLDKRRCTRYLDWLAHKEAK